MNRGVSNTLLARKVKLSVSGMLEGFTLPTRGGQRAKFQSAGWHIRPFDHLTPARLPVSFLPCMNGVTRLWCVGIINPLYSAMPLASVRTLKGVSDRKPVTT